MPTLVITLKATNGYVALLCLLYPTHHTPGLAGRKERPEEGVAAVARKLAVLLHRLWATKQPYVLSMKLKPLAVAAGSDLAIT
jgi:hypothetical protein